MKNIVLIGFMGTGKTTIAMDLANSLNMRYISTDDLIEKREKATINEIFREKGEGYFRDVESDVIRSLVSGEGMVIDTGGGAVMRQENMENLKSLGIVICVSADVDTIMERTKKYKHRPLLNVDDPKRKIRELLASRAAYYAKADHTFDTGKYTARQVVDQISDIFSGGFE